MGKYKTIKNSPYILREDGALIPFDDQNGDYQEFKRWISLGNTPDPPDPSNAPLDQNNPNTPLDQNNPSDIRKILKAIKKINDWIKGKDDTFNPIDPAQ